MDHYHYEYAEDLAILSTYSTACQTGTILPMILPHRIGRMGRKQLYESYSVENSGARPSYYDS